MKNKAMNTVSKALTEKAEEAHIEFKICTNGMHRLAKGLKTGSKEDVKMLLL